MTLTATIRSEVPAGTKFDYVWRQVQGPTVLLSSIGEAATGSLQSITSFTPTTSRVHGFELSIFPLESSGDRSGLFVTRRINVLVNSATSEVPEAEGLATPGRSRWRARPRSAR